jgi:hypothetical protein
MEDDGKRCISAFDALCTTNQTQMLKILLARMTPAGQGTLAVYIKLLELAQTIRYFRSHSFAPVPGWNPFPLTFSLDGDDTSETLKLLDELLPFAGPGEKERIESMKRMLKNLEQVREMTEMLKTLQELFPEGFGESSNPADLFSMLSQTGGMDLSELARMMKDGA